MTHPSIAIIAGGSSREAAVSRSSAAEVAKALKLKYANVSLLELDEKLPQVLLALKPDVVFPVLHGPPGEDGTIQGFLEILGLPYVGSDVHASAVAMNKNVAKALFRQASLPVSPDVLIAADANLAAAQERIHAELGERVVLKPLNQGSAIGVIPVMNGGDLGDQLFEAVEHFGSVLVEPFIMGREMTVGILSTPESEPVVAPVIEIRTPDGSWYDYEHRYDANLSEHLIPARIHPDSEDRLREVALLAHQVLGCRDLSRADFILTENAAGEEQLVLLEVNSLPGMTPTSLYPDGMAALGIDFADLMSRLVESALRRGP